MERVTITYARTHFSELAARAEAGETIEITRRGKPVARLEPIEAQNLCRQPSVAAIEDFLAQAAVEARGRGREPAVG